MHFNLPKKNNYIFAFTVFLASISLNVAAQQYDPFDGKSADFHVKLSRYFKNPESEKMSRMLLLDSINNFKTDSLWNLKNLRSHLDTYESLLVSVERHDQYFRLRTYINNKDSLAKQSYNEVDEAEGMLQGETGRLLLKPAFSSVTDQQLDQYQLKKYKFLLAEAKQEATHSLSDHDEQLISKISDDMIDHLTDRYDVLMDNIKGDSIAIGHKNYTPVDLWSSILTNPDSALRRRVSTAYYKAYDEHAEVLAATLIDITRQKNTLAKLRGFKNAPERAYARRLQLSEASVKQMLTNMATHTDVLKDYQRLQADHIKRLTGLTTVHSWDTSLPSGFKWQPVSFANTRIFVLNSLAPLGKTYTGHFSFLLNPENGEMDIASGPNRLTENTSIGFIGVPESLYMKGYNGSLSNVLHLIHEGGHAIHEQLMSDNHIVPSYKNGPNMLYEAYAIFNELLLLDALKDKEKTPEGKAFYITQFLNKLSLEIFTSAEEGSFEQGLNQGVSNGTINNREDIDKLYTGIMNKYDSYFPNEPQRRSEWIRKRLVFDDPIYNVNYLYAILISCKLFQLQHDDPKYFAKNYTALLKNGFDAPANELVKKYMGFSLDSNSLLEGALGLMRERILALKSLYNSNKL